MAKQEIPELDAAVRERLGSRYARRLREQGQLPAVVYGHQEQPVHIALDHWRFEYLLDHGAHLLRIALDSGHEPCLVKDVQYDHLGAHVVHADLTRVDLSEEVEVELEIHLTGEPAALSEEGAMIDQPLTTLTVRCRADSIPENITHDISELGEDEAVTVADLQLPPGVATDVDPETMVAQVQVMQEQPEEEAVPAEGEEPEVVGKKASDEGEDEGAGESAEGESEGE